MPQLRNIHHFVAGLFRLVCKSNWQTRPQKLYLNKDENKDRQICTRNNKGGKAKVCGRNRNQSTATRDHNKKSQWPSPLLSANDMNCNEGIKTMATKIRATNKNES